MARTIESPSFAPREVQIPVFDVRNFSGEVGETREVGEDPIQMPTSLRVREIVSNIFKLGDPSLATRAASTMQAFRISTKLPQQVSS